MANDDLVIEVESILRRQKESVDDHVNQRPSIFRVPSILRDVSRQSFTPQLVSIGPLHKEDSYVQDMERLKGSYMNDLLNRSSDQPETIWLLRKVGASINQIRSSYSATRVTKYYNDAELANMMVMDGCFILEFCFKEIHHEKEKPTMLKKIQRTRIAVDLMLFENQIPFFVLQDIFDLTKPNSINLSLTSLLREALLKYVHLFYTPKTNFPGDFSVPNVSKISDPEHILDCLHKIYQFESSEIENAQIELEKNKAREIFTHSVSALKRSGLKFKPQVEKNKALAMRFDKASSCVMWPWRMPNTLVMPTLIIHASTEAVLRNLIAYEQLCPRVNYFLTSYSFFMDKLIYNDEDVVNLEESRVLINLLGSHKEAARLIKSISTNIVLEEFYYTKEIIALDEYYKNRFAHLRRTYFKSPWNYYNLLAGIILFGLTLVQTIFTITSNYK